MDRFLPLIKTVANDCVESCEENLHEHTVQNSNDMQDFREEIQDIWGEPLKYLEMMRIIFLQSGESAFSDASDQVLLGEQKPTSLLV